MSIEERLYVVRFDRIGRGHCVGQEVTFNAATSASLAEQVYRYAQSKIASKMFEVTVDIETGRGWIESGRFGTFTIEDRGTFHQ